MAPVFQMLGQAPHEAMATSDGRIGMVVETPGRIYRFKMERDRPARGAMARIEAKRYTARRPGGHQAGRELRLENAEHRGAHHPHRRQVRTRAWGVARWARRTHPLRDAPL